MKQILLVLLFTGLAAAGFVVTRSLTQPDEQPTRGLPSGLAPRGQGNVQAPQPQRPAIDPGAEQVTVIPEGLQAEIDRRKSFDWQSAAGQESVVKPEEIWTADFSDVDFTADVVFERDDVVVTRDDWRAYAMADLGASLIDARLGRDLSIAFAARAGVDASFTDAEHDAMLAAAAARRNQDVGTFLAQSALEYRLPPAGVSYLRRMAIESVVGYMLSFAPGELAPSPLEALMRVPENREFTTTLSETLHGLMADLIAHRATSDEVDPELMRRIGATVDALTVAQTGARISELAYRSWSRYDDPLPEGVLAAIKTDEIEGLREVDERRVPWELPGDVAYVQLDEIWQQLGPGIARSEQERLLNDLLFYRVLRQDLERRGTLPSAEEIWMEFIEDYEAGQRTAFSAAMVHLQLEGFPSFERLREMRRLREGFERSLPQDWNDEDSLRAYFEQNRFFIEHWSLQLSMALFPAVDVTDPSGSVDWERAREGAQELVDRVRAGESFDTLREEHMQELAAALAENVGAAAADGFLGAYGQRVIRGSMTQIEEMLDRSIYRDLVEGFSVPAAAAATLGPAEVSDPWRTGVGYVVVQLIDATVGGLENEFEDLVFGTEDHFKRQGFKRYASTTLRNFLAGS